MSKINIYEFVEKQRKLLTKFLDGWIEYSLNCSPDEVPEFNRTEQDWKEELLNWENKD